MANRSTSSVTIAADPVGLGAAQREAAVGPVAQVVEVEQRDAGQLGDRPVDGAGHGDVDDEQRRGRRAGWPRRRRA